MATLTVGTGQQFSTIAAAVAASHDGDVIAVEAGTYTNDFATISDKITIEGVGGMVHLVASGNIPNGKAILITNTDVTLDHIEFSGATVADGNGAGIRYQGGNLTIENCYFHDNQDGLLGAAVPGGSITIDHSEFAHNGTGTGQTHNLYVGDIATLTVTNSYFHDAVVGHEIKSRAEANIIENNVIADGPNGTASYSIDLPNGGAATIQNNVIEKGPLSQNPAVIHYGGETPTPYANSSLAISGNTILDDDHSSSSTLLLNQTGIVASIASNQIFGLTGGQLNNGPATVSGNTFLTTEPAINMSHPWQSSPAPAPAPVPSPAPAPAPAPAPGPTSGGSFGTGSDTLVLNLSEDAWQGDAQFTVAVDGKQIGGPLSVTVLHSAGGVESFTFHGDWAVGTHQVAVNFINDAYGGTPTTDRNLYVTGATYDGQAVTGAAKALFSNGSDSFSVTDTTASPTPAPAPAPAPVPAPAPAPGPTSGGSFGTGSDTLVLNLSEDAWQGNAQFTVAVDGKQIGGPLSVTALHSAGGVESFTFHGDWAVGTHQVAVNFINDAWGGTATTDRNLYVTAATYDGHAVAGAAKALYSNGSDTFSVGDTTAVPSVIAANLQTTNTTQVISADTSGATLTAKPGHDRFVFTHPADHDVVINAFNAHDDVLDLRALVTAAGHAGANPIAGHVLALHQSGADTVVSVDPGGAGLSHPHTLVTLHDVVASSLQPGHSLLWH